MYLYEMHLHTGACSKCGAEETKDIIYAYKEAGYTGIVITDHFFGGNTGIPREWDWESKVKAYYDNYLQAKEEAKEYDFDVIFGLEDGYRAKGKEILIYGIELDLLLAHPELERTTLDVWAPVVHEAGGLIYHAHPHRVRGYIDPSIKPQYDLCDGIEVYNAGNYLEENIAAYKDAIRLDKPMLSGGDFHKFTDNKLGKAGMIFDHRIKDGKELCKALRSKQNPLLIQGKLQYMDKLGESEDEIIRCFSGEE